MLIYGKNVCYEKLKSNDKIARAFVSERFNDKDIISLLKSKNIKTNFVKSFVLDHKVEGLHQGIVLEIEDIETFDLKEIIPNIKKEFPLVVMLDHLEDPHNFGAIIRTSEALGVDAIIIPTDRSVQVTSTVVKTSVGAINYIPIVKVANLNSTIKYLKDNGYWIVGTDMEGTNYTEIDYKVPICLVIGNEGMGISKVVSENCDYIASIPMTGRINSLNASVSCGILLSEIVNNRKR